jgi:hypothetical protein
MRGKSWCVAAALISVQTPNKITVQIPEFTGAAIGKLQVDKKRVVERASTLTALSQSQENCQ